MWPPFPHRQGTSDLYDWICQEGELDRNTENFLFWLSFEPETSGLIIKRTNHWVTRRTHTTGWALRVQSPPVASNLVTRVVLAIWWIVGYINPYKHVLKRVNRKLHSLFISIPVNEPRNAIVTVITDFYKSPEEERIIKGASDLIRYW